MAKRYQVKQVECSKNIGFFSEGEIKDWMKEDRLDLITIQKLKNLLKNKSA